MRLKDKTETMCNMRAVQIGEGERGRKSRKKKKKKKRNLFLYFFAGLLTVFGNACVRGREPMCDFFRLFVLNMAVIH